MAVGLQVEVQPLCEPVSLSDMKNYMKVPSPDDDSLIQSMIIAAREHVEMFTRRSLVNKGFVQTMDSFPYNVDTTMSQQAYPPSYYSAPRYSTTFWNYSQMIKLLVSPLYSMTSIIYLGTDQQYHAMQQGVNPWKPLQAYAQGTKVVDGNDNWQVAQNSGNSAQQPPNVISSASAGQPPNTYSWSTVLNGITTESTGLIWANAGPDPLYQFGPSNLNANTFLADAVCEPPRLFPGPAGATWPPVDYAPNAVELHFVAGYGPAVSSGSPAVFTPPVGIPDRCITAILQLVSGWYENRDSVSALTMKEMPNHLKALLWSVRVEDMQPTRG